IVAIGASAGGLEAIHEFFDNMPVSGNLSFIIIQHLSTDYKSLLVELVAKHTEMKVYEATHETLVEKNCIYVIPNDKLLTVSQGKLQLGVKNFEKSPNTAIDTFLLSLAEDQGAKAIAVILSGTGTDGTRGIEAVHQGGGMVLVQDPITAKFDGMPNSAIASGYVDYILSPELMPEQIFNHIKENPSRKYASAFDEKHLPDVLQLIEKSCGYDFHNYKTPTIMRRIARRMQQVGKGSFNDYIDLLQSSPEECRVLGKEFLIGVTKFFRDMPAFTIFDQEVLPDMVRTKTSGTTLKVWVTACSTGQEAYTIAMIMDNYLRTVGKDLELKIFATDIDIDAIEFASKGVFPASAVEDVPSEYLGRYFLKQGDQYIIEPSLRKKIVFARHNILKDPPFIKNDMITCRNMLIYMNSILQRKVLSTLQYSLNTGGYLFLGPSEIPASISSTLSEVNSKWKFYRKLFNERPYQPTPFNTSSQLKTSREIRSTASSRESWVAKELAEDFKNILTEEYGFAAVYIDKNYEIKEAVGDFRKYLSLPQKIVNLNVLKMVSAELSIALNTAIRKAIKENSKVTLNSVRVREGSEEKYLNLLVKPPSSREGYMMIVFGEGNEVTFSRSNTDISQHNTESAAYITELEEELKETRINLQMAVESLETTNEELQSSNEELLSANEELQSSNEELQSLNEELHTLNTEHQLRIKELIELNDDLNNYFRSTEIGQLFVGNDLRIRKFNPAVVKLINLIESDIGRPIEHISTNIQDKNLLPDIREVMLQGNVIEKEVTLKSNMVSLMRILPYIRQDKQIDGVVITFFDISHIKELDNIIKGTFNASQSAIMAFRSIRNKHHEITDFTWVAANHTSDEFLKKSNAEYMNKSLKEELPSLVKNGLFEKLVQVVQSNQPLRTEMVLDKGDAQWFDVVATRMMDGLVITLTNINEKKESEEKLRRNYHELIKAKENLKALNASLEQKVAERTHDLAESEERFRLIASSTSDVVWDWNLVNNDLWWSDSFYKLFGFDKNGSTINTGAFWLGRVHPEDRERVNNSIQEAINKGTKNWTAQYRFQKADGTYVILLDKGSVVTDEAGVPYRMLGAMADVTKVEQTEQQLQEKNEELHRVLQEFRFVTDFMPQMVWVTKPDGYHEYYNKRWYDYTGLDMATSQDKGWSLVLHPDDYDRTWVVWRHSLETGENYEIEYRMRGKDGTYRWFLGRAIPLRDEQGNIIKWFG
ncbi:MAG TPA: chemotaxis protein CheB, partial [Chitinophagaceae bacterium]